MNRPVNILSIVLSVLLAAGCAKEMASNEFPENVEGRPLSYAAIVSVKQSPTDTLYFQVDDTTRLFPRNFTDEKLVGERIVCDISVYNKVMGSYGYVTDVNYYDSIDNGEFTADVSAPGDDGLDIVFDWMTGAEDGYLTLHYSTWWGDEGIRHRFRLIAGTNPEDPYELVLRHDAAGDKHQEQGESLVYFDINTLPETGDEYKILTLKWKDCAGKTESHKFRFKSRK